MPDRESMDRMRSFLSVASQFRLGDLPTEQPHPLTRNLDSLAAEDPLKALRILHEIDGRALRTLSQRLDGVFLLAERIKATFDARRRVFLVGCGSTGRLSLALESIWRREKAGTDNENGVFAFMAGGDGALVQSVEGFEDFPEYGERQLLESGFRDGDLLVATTEGGETPFVIGAVRLAAEISANPPFFLFCNPEDVLARVAARSAAVLYDARIEKINLSVGPMALSGSTRMQASTVLMAAVGAALLEHGEPGGIPVWLGGLISFWNGLDTTFLADFVKEEAALYQAGSHLLYLADPELAITVLTDTTERSPTFSMHPFENDLDPMAKPSLCSLCLPASPTREAAWRQMLGRDPQGLPWKGIARKAAPEWVQGFDFSAAGRDLRKARIVPAFQAEFHLGFDSGGVDFDLGRLFHRMPTGGLPLLSIHLVLKMLLNAHSTLVMGRLGRYQGNLMTWVKPSNHKLVDRAIRYADLLLRKKGMIHSYERIAEVCFRLQESPCEGGPLVPAMVERLSGTASGGGTERRRLEDNSSDRETGKE